MTDGAAAAAVVRLWMLPDDATARRRLCRDNAVLLSADEQAAVAAARRPQVAERLLASRVLLRLALSRHLGCPPRALRFDRLASGRLALAGPVTAAFSFNLSHGGAATVVAVSESGEVGVDIEATDRGDVARKIARTFFATDERDEIAASDSPGLRALQLWTLKECVVKALGLTVWDGLERFRFSLRDEAILMRDGPTAAPPGWRLALGDTPGHVLAAALRLPPGDERPASFRLDVLGDGQAAGGRPFPTRTSRRL